MKPSRLLFLSLLVPSAGSVAAQTHHIVDRPIDSFETGIAVPSNAVAHWIGNDALLITALPAGAVDEPWTGGDTLTSVAFVSLATRRVRVIADHSVIVEFDQESSDAIIGPRDRKTDSREVHVTAEGRVVEIERIAPGDPLPRMMPDFPKDQLVQPLARVKDGYLLGDKTKLQEHTRSGTPVPTTWIRPGKPDIRLPIDFEEVGPEVIYVDFLNEYLLNSVDPQTSSNTNSHMNRVWRHSYTYTPFRLLSLDGTIEEIPYPQFVFDYGLGKFSEFRLTRAGIVVSQITSIGGAIYLYQGQQLYRLTHRGALGVSRSLPMSGVTGLSISPDGCNIAYLHYDVRPIFVKGTIPRYLTILNVCDDLSRR